MNRKKCPFVLLLALCFAYACTPKEDPLPEVDDVCAMMDDLVFMKYCYDNFDVNQDGKVSRSEAEAVTKIDMYSNSYYSISTGPYAELRSLKGLEYFVNLVELDCTRTAISSIDVTRNTKLELLALGGTDISSINTSKCPALKELSVWETNITQLDLSKNAELVVLNAEHLNISNIDVSKCPKLTSLYLSHTNVTELDISQNELIDDLSIGNDGLTVRIKCVKVPENYWSYGERVIFSRNGQVIPSSCYIEWEGKIYNDREPYIDIGVGESITVQAVPDMGDVNVTFVWESGNESVVDVRDGIVTGKEEGYAVIYAIPITGGKRAGCHITVKPAAKSVKISESEKQTLFEVGDEWLLHYSLEPYGTADRGVEWTSSDPSVMKITNKKDIHGSVSYYAKMVGPGTAKLTVKTASGGLTASSEVNVTEKIIPVTGVTLNKESLSLYVGQTDTLVATIIPENATFKNVTWKSMDQSVATVDANGVVKAVGTGKTYIRCNSSSSISEGLWVTVSPAPVALTGLGFDKDEITLKVGKKTSLTIKITPPNASGWNINVSCDQSIVKLTVASNTVLYLEGVSAGTTQIVAKNKDGDQTATCKVTVVPSTVAVNRIYLDKTSLSLVEGNKATLSASISPADATNKAVTWSSSNTSVATVSSSGVVTAKSAGSANITVKTSDGSKTATCSVTVKAATISVTSVSLNKTSMSLEEGKAATLTATISPSNATNKAVTWSSSNTSVATVSSSGVVTAKSAGTANITVKTNDGSKTETCSVTVKSHSSDPPPGGGEGTGDEELDP